MLAEREFKQIADLVYRHCGINLHDGKRELVDARVAKRVREGGYATAEAYLRHVIGDGAGGPGAGDEFGHLIDAISTNLTSFFRESNHFHYLVEHHLPGVLDRKRKRGTNRVRGWSAGCSTGEEPCTIAMVIAEATAADAARGEHWDLKLLATDISRKVLAVARNGTYDAARLSGVPAFMQKKYFAPGTAPGTLRAAASIRDRITFNYLNLMGPWPFEGPFDFIFCRNVMIYFDKPTQERLVNRYYDVLEPGGVLFTGHSESLTGIKHKFSYAQPTIYLKK